VARANVEQFPGRKGSSLECFLEVTVIFVGRDNSNGFPGCVSAWGRAEGSGKSYIPSDSVSSVSSYLGREAIRYVQI
jgi:hypothetical protein